MTESGKATAQLSRRRFVATGIGAAAFASSRLASAAAIAPGGFDPEDPVSVLRAVTRMRGSVDDRITMGWLKAQRYGVVDAELTPLLGMVTGTFARHKILKDGSVVSDSFELAFYTDLDSGEVLETLTVPYTGKTVKVPRLLLGPSRSTVRPVFHEVIETRDDEERTDSTTAMRPEGSNRIERWLGPVASKGSDVWITQSSTAVRIPADPNTRKIVYSEAVTTKAAYADVNNPELATIAATLSYTGVSSWRPWMQMGNHPGHTTAHGIGNKAFHQDDLPDDYRAMAERFYPEAIANPGGLLDKIG